MPELQLSDVQGNILGGFLKDHQTFLMFTVIDANAVKAWVRAKACDQVATAEEVKKFNDLFRELRSRRGEHAGIKATWMNIAFSRRGLELLGAPEIGQMDPAFAAPSVADRARSVLGDSNKSAPENWIEHYRGEQVHVLVILASDDPNDLREYLNYMVNEATANGLGLVASEEGNALPAPLTGHEHFGYKDGVSQPRIDGVDEGANLLPPWQFLVNAEAQPLTPPPQPGQPGYGQVQAPPPHGPPQWTHQGSYLVFRRLRQDVAMFNAWIEQETPHTLDPDRFGAKVVGRYKDGAPYERVPGCAYDPDAGEPSRRGEHDVCSDTNINNFDYNADPDGRLTPHAAHTRKTNPRSSLNAQPVRIIRRGVAYGMPLDPEADDNSRYGRNGDRGLLFVSYQASIANQFEFIQQTWANNGAFPAVAPPAGQDLIIGQSASGLRDFVIPLPIQSHSISGVPTFVVTTGTLYCFSPSISALKSIGS